MTKESDEVKAYEGAIRYYEEYGYSHEDAEEKVGAELLMVNREFFAEMLKWAIGASKEPGEIKSACDYLYSYPERLIRIAKESGFIPKDYFAQLIEKPENQWMKEVLRHD